MKAIVLYLHVHQPYRIGPYSVFDIAKQSNYFGSDYEHDTNNQRIIDKVAGKSYIPTNAVLLELLQKHPAFKVSLSITGTILDQFEAWAPEVLESFKQLVKTGRVEIVGETYYHSLAFFYSRDEFEAQVKKHADRVFELFGVRPTAFRNTELSYNNDLAYWADKSGYKAIIAEGWDPVLGWRSPNFVYQPSYSNSIKLLLKNYRLSDDIAFRFGNQAWESWPLDADTYAHWLNSDQNADVFNLFMDYETFGEHQWASTGIFEFLKALPEKWLADDRTFMTISEAADSYEAKDHIDTPHTTTWADTERDLSAWLGNPMQQESIKALYDLEHDIKKSGDQELLEDWRKMTTSDHFYYMCTKWFSDGDIHAYFSPYDNPYDAYVYFMNAWQDLRRRVIEKDLR